MMEMRVTTNRGLAKQQKSKDSKDKSLNVARLLTLLSNSSTAKR